MSNNIMMMSIPELDKAKRQLTALNEAHDTIYLLAEKNGFSQAFQIVLGDLVVEADKVEIEILSIEKNYGGNDGRY